MVIGETVLIPAFLNQPPSDGMLGSNSCTALHLPGLPLSTHSACTASNGTFDSSLPKAGVECPKLFPQPVLQTKGICGFAMLTYTFYPLLLSVTVFSSRQSNPEFCGALKWT